MKDKDDALLKETEEVELTELHIQLLCILVGDLFARAIIKLIKDSQDEKVDPKS